MVGPSDQFIEKYKAKPPRAQKELFGAALLELRARLERDRHKGPGGLMHFVRYFWPVLEPNREFEEGWALDAMAEHLEAVSDGRITRLLINIPPGSMKSLMVNVFWPAWEWATINSGLRYISFSYSSLLTERDNQRFLDLLESKEFQGLYGTLFDLRSKGVTKVSNDRHGWKFASSVRGTGTGERGDRVLCFPEETLVATEHGPVPIGEIVRKRLNVRVWSRNPETGCIELRPVTAFHHNPGSDLVRVRYTGGSVRCTPDHRFWVEGRGWVEARRLIPGDVLPCQSFSNAIDSSCGHAESGSFVVPFVTRDWHPRFSIVNCVVPDEHIASTFCLGVENTGNMFVGGRQHAFIIAHNCDDPHNVKEGESQVIREETVRWFKEAMSNRLNHMTKSAIIVIMQRISESDVSGTIISEGLPYEHLMIPLFYEPGRAGPTSIGWTDPRTVEGENYWPARVPPAAVEEILQMGEFAVAAQYQQRPEPRGGGIFKREWWNIWDPEDGKYPPFSFILASCDPAYTKQEGNDPSGFVILGVNYADDGTARVFVIAAWRKHLSLHGPDIRREVGESAEAFLSRQKETWGLVEWIAHTCRRFSVHRLLVEAKASGISVVQELERLMLNREFGIEFVNPGRADKTVRANRVQHLFSAGMIYRPDRDWAVMVEDEMAAFNPVKKTSKYDDITDAMTQALWYLRQHRFLERREELAAANVVPAGIPTDDAPLYPL